LVCARFDGQESLKGQDVQKRHLINIKDLHFDSSLILMIAYGHSVIQIQEFQISSKDKPSRSTEYFTSLQ
jgi:hypothetical protein